MYIPDAHGGQKRVPGPQGLESLIAVNYHVGAGKEPKFPGWVASEPSLQPLPCHFLKWIISDGILLVSTTIIPLEYVSKSAVA